MLVQAQRHFLSGPSTRGLAQDDKTDGPSGTTHHPPITTHQLSRFLRLRILHRLDVILDHLRPFVLEREHALVSELVNHDLPPRLAHPGPKPWPLMHHKRDLASVERSLDRLDELTIVAGHESISPLRQRLAPIGRKLTHRFDYKGVWVGRGSWVVDGGWCPVPSFTTHHPLLTPAAPFWGQL